MKIQDRYNSLNLNSQKIFEQSLEKYPNLSQSHHYAAFINDFAEFIGDKKEKEILKIVSEQLDTANLSLMYGFYRQSFSSLRLAFELGLGAVYFSLYKLEHHEWINGKNDIKWSRLIDDDKGVFSARVSKSFFIELEELMPKFQSEAKLVYRKLSEFVHGNYETWKNCELNLVFNDQQFQSYFEVHKQVTNILIFILCCRYLKDIDSLHKESISEFLLEELGSISPIREYLGGPKGIN